MIVVKAFLKPGNSIMTTLVSPAKLQDFVKTWLSSSVDLFCVVVLGKMDFSLVLGSRTESVLA